MTFMLMYNRYGREMIGFIFIFLWIHHQNKPTIDLYSIFLLVMWIYSKNYCIHFFNQYFFAPFIDHTWGGFVRFYCCLSLIIKVELKIFIAKSLNVPYEYDW